MVHLYIQTLWCSEELCIKYIKCSISLREAVSAAARRCACLLSRYIVASFWYRKISPFMTFYCLRNSYERVAREAMVYLFYHIPYTISLIIYTRLSKIRDNFAKSKFRFLHTTMNASSMSYGVYRFKDGRRSGTILKQYFLVHLPIQ